MVDIPLSYTKVLWQIHNVENDRDRSGRQNAISVYQHRGFEIPFFYSVLTSAVAEVGHRPKATPAVCFLLTQPTSHHSKEENGSFITLW